MNIYLEHKDKRINRTGVISDSYVGYSLDKKLYIKAPLVIDWLKGRLNNVVSPHKYLEGIRKSEEHRGFTYNPPNTIVYNMVASYLGISFNLSDGAAIVRDYIEQSRLIETNKIIIWEGLRESEEEATEKDVLKAKEYINNTDNIIEALSSKAGFITVDLLVDFIGYLKENGEEEDIKEAQSILSSMLSLESKCVNLSEIRLVYLDAEDSEIINFVDCAS